MRWKNIISLSSLLLFLFLVPMIYQKDDHAREIVPELTKKPELLVEKPAVSEVKLDYRLIDANTQFGLNLFSAIAEQESRENIFISPMSVAIALTMVYNGADGKTQQQMAQTLALREMSLPEINQAYGVLMANLPNADENISLNIANSLWIEQKLPLKSEFKTNLHQYYSAQLQELDFNHPQAVEMINGWVSKQTQNKIKQIIEQINPADVLYLINAIYFKGDWTYPFDSTLTKNLPFYDHQNIPIKEVPMMSRQGEYSYHKNELFQAISIPYGEERFSMYIFLPHSDQNLDRLISKLNGKTWHQWTTSLKQREGLLMMPRWQLEYDLELEEILSNLGMKAMFKDASADFSAMTSEPVAVDRVTHKTFVEVNEQGTEAAAVTSITMRTTAVRAEKPFTMIVNRPFLCAIQDEVTGSILFLGKIAKP